MVCKERLSGQFKGWISQICFLAQNLFFVNTFSLFAHPQFIRSIGDEKGSGPIQRTRKVWSGRIPRKGFIGQYLFWMKQIRFNGKEHLRTEKSWFPIHLKPGLMKPWRGICPDPLRKEAKTGGGQAFHWIGILIIFFKFRKVSSGDNGFDKVGRVGQSFSGNVISCAMIDGGPDERQPQGKVD